MEAPRSDGADPTCVNLGAEIHIIGMTRADWEESRIGTVFLRWHGTL